LLQESSRNSGELESEADLKKSGKSSFIKAPGEKYNQMMERAGSFRSPEQQPFFNRRREMRGIYHPHGLFLIVPGKFPGFSRLEFERDP